MVSLCGQVPDAFPLFSRKGGIARVLSDVLHAGVQTGEVEPFVCELLTSLTAIIQDLETHQIHMFFEAVGLMIAAELDAKKREVYLVSPKRTCGLFVAILRWVSCSSEKGQRGRRCSLLTVLGISSTCIWHVGHF